MPLGDFSDFDPNNPYTAIALLGERVKNLGIEKEALERREEALEKRIAKMENSFQRGAGILMVLPIIGTIAGLIIAYGKVLLRPWSGTP